jgi:hypothetical protein
MPNEELGSFLGKNLKAVKFGKDGGIEIPIRANERDGITFGVDAIAEREHALGVAATRDSDRSVPRHPWWRRLSSRS